MLWYAGVDSTLSIAAEDAGEMLAAAGTGATELDLLCDRLMTVEAANSAAAFRDVDPFSASFIPTGMSTASSAVSAPAGTVPVAHASAAATVTTGAVTQSEPDNGTVLLMVEWEQLFDFCFMLCMLCRARTAAHIKCIFRKVIC